MKPPAVVKRIFDALDRHHPGADTELVYRNPFELLVATMLSAQSTDARVNLVTPALFARFPTATAMAGADTGELENLIHATGFFRQKSKSLIGMSSRLLSEHNGDVPASMEALTALPGVGRKTANVVLGHALGVPGLPVDRHVLRVSNRIGLVRSDDPVKVEAALGSLLPPGRWTRASDALILHGRRICRPAPLCPRCHVRNDCDYFRTGGVTKVTTSTRKPPKAKLSPNPSTRKPSQAKSSSLPSTRKPSQAKSSSLRAGRAGGAKAKKRARR